MIAGSSNSTLNIFPENVLNPKDFAGFRKGKWLVTDGNKYKMFQFALYHCSELFMREISHWC